MYSPDCDSPQQAGLRTDTLEMCAERDNRKSSKPPKRRRPTGGARASPAGRSHQQKLLLTRKCFKTHSETSLASDHPVRACSERDHFFDGAATPPLQGELSRIIPYSSKISS